MSGNAVTDNRYYPRARAPKAHPWSAGMISSSVDHASDVYWFRGFLCLAWCVSQGLSISTATKGHGPVRQVSGPRGEHARVQRLHTIGACACRLRYKVRTRMKTISLPTKPIIGRYMLWDKFQWVSDRGAMTNWLLEETSPAELAWAETFSLTWLRRASYFCWSILFILRCVFRRE